MSGRIYYIYPATKIDILHLLEESNWIITPQVTRRNNIWRQKKTPKPYSSGVSNYGAALLENSDQENYVVNIIGCTCTRKKGKKRISNQYTTNENI